MNNNPINAQQIKFYQEYLIDFNATNAAIRSGYKPASAASRGCRLLKDPDIKAHIDELQAEQRKNNMATFEKVKEELSFLAFSNISEFVDFQNDIADLRYIDKNKKRAISSIQISKTENKSGNQQRMSIKMYDKLQALKVLAKHLGFYKEKEEKKEHHIKNVYIVSADMDDEVADQKIAEIEAAEKAKENEQETVNG